MGNTVVPFKGKFENWRALLASIMERDDIEHLIVLATHTDGTTGNAHFECTRQELAWFSLILAGKAMADD